MIPLLHVALLKGDASWMAMAERYGYLRSG